MNNDCEIIIPTYYPGKIICSLIKSIPKKYNIKIIDNSLDDNLKKILSKFSHNINYIKIGDVGLGKSFNYALSNTVSKFAFITQPDVTLNENCIENLIVVANQFQNAAIISPLYFNDGTYSIYDFYDLKLTKSKKIIDRKKNKHFINLIPDGNISVEAINSTALLIDVNKIKSIGGWDNNFYTYLEDIDLCLRVRQKGYEIIKTPLASINHKGFSSHSLANTRNMNISRIWNFTWSSIYFAKKHRSKNYFYFFIFSFLLKNVLKLIFNYLIGKKLKITIYKIRINACINFFLKKTYLESEYKKN